LVQQVAQLAQPVVVSAQLSGQVQALDHHPQSDMYIRQGDAEDQNNR
jgi:hypothetical protein